MTILYIYRYYFLIVFVRIVAMDNAALDAHLQELLGACLDEITVDSLVDAFDQRMAKTNETQANFFAKGQEGRKPQIVTEDSRVRLMYGTSVTSVTDSWPDDGFCCGLG